MEKRGVPTTDDSPKFSENEHSTTVAAIWEGSRFVDSIGETSDYAVAIVSPSTNFYAERGGQVGDAGLAVSTGGKFRIETTRAVGQYVLHVGRVEAGTIRVGDGVLLSLAAARSATQKNHTATHLANWALRETLGDSVQQKGSLVDAEKLRFDFSHGSPLTDEQIRRTESLVDAAVAKGLAVHTQTVPQESAMKSTACARCSARSIRRWSAS